MKNSTHFTAENFDQEAYYEADHDFDGGSDDLLFEQLAEVAEEEPDFYDLERAEEEEDNFDGIF